MTVGDIGNNQIEQISRSFQAVGESLKRNNWFGHTYLAIDSNNDVTTTWFKSSSGASFESITNLVEKIINKKDISDIDKKKILDAFAQIRDKFEAKQPSMLTLLTSKIFKNYLTDIQTNKNLLLMRANDLIDQSQKKLLPPEKKSEPFTQHTDDFDYGFDIISGPDGDLLNNWADETENSPVNANIETRKVNLIELEEVLNIWVEQEGGEAKEAVHRIKEAYTNKQSELDLQGLNLKSLPSAVNHLTYLTQLNLGNNAFENWPEEINNLSQLKMLALNDNSLKIMPDLSGKLLNLTVLDLSLNSFDHLPKSLLTFSNLRELSLSHNEITFLPAWIGDLSNLTVLNLSSNDLTSLPPEIGKLGNLTDLSISKNYELKDIPTELQQCTNLENFEYDLIEISEEKQNEFIHLLNEWEAFSGGHFDFQFIQNFNNSKKDMVYQWLKKLEASEQFKSQAKQPIAKATCQMLQTLNSPIFQERFFALVSDDLAGCGDRAAMLFNNLFLEWKLSTLDANAPKVNQLTLMVGASKTLTLRQALQSRISEKERELRHEVEKKFPTLSQQEQKEKWQIGESAEIYLYYETKLKKSLNLLTFMDTMSYTLLGKSDWIDEQELVAEVEKEYIDALNHLPSFITLRDADADFISRWQTAKTDIDKKTDQLEDQISDGSINDYDYKIAMEHLGKELDIKKNDVTREWLQETLKIWAKIQRRYAKTQRSG